MTLGSRRDATSLTSCPQSYQGKHEAAGLVSAPQTSAPAGTGSSAHFPSLLLQPFHSSPAVAGNPQRNAQSRITSWYKHAQPHRPSQGRCSLVSVSHHTTCCLDYLQKQPPVSVPAPFFFGCSPKCGVEGHASPFMAQVLLRTSRIFPEQAQPWLGNGDSLCSTKDKARTQRVVGCPPAPPRPPAPVKAAKNSACRRGSPACPPVPQWGPCLASVALNGVLQQGVSHCRNSPTSGGKYAS